MVAKIVTMDMSRWATSLVQLRERFVPAVKRGLKRGGLASIPILHRATELAPAANPGGTGIGAFNYGIYKRAWKTYSLPDSQVIINDTPYAGIIESGRRPGLAPPRVQIARWAQRKFNLSEADALRAAFAIARAIAARGLIARRVMTNSLPAIMAAVNNAIDAELLRELARGTR